MFTLLEREYLLTHVYRNGELYSEYDGERNAQAIIDWVRRKSGPPSTQVNTVEEWNTLSNQDALAHILFLTTEGKEDNLNTFVSIADIPDFSSIFRFGHTTNEALSVELKQSLNTIVVFKEEGQVVVYDGEFDKEKIVAWIKANAYPLVEKLVLDQEFIQRTAREAVPLLLAFRQGVEGSTEEAQLEFVKTLATNSPAELNVHYLEALTKDYPGLVGQWGASETKFPAFILVRFPSGAPPSIKAFDEDQELTPENIYKWIETCVHGDYCPYNVKSQPIVESEEGGVKTLVGKNIQSVIFDPTKDVLIELYSPDCPHCVMLAPTWEALGKVFENIDSVVIAKMDAVANSVPEEIPISGYPTILFYRADENSNYIFFDEQRDVETLTQFVLANAANPIDKSKLVDVSPKKEETQSQTQNEEDVKPAVEVEAPYETVQTNEGESIVPPTEDQHVKDEL